MYIPTKIQKSVQSVAGISLASLTSAGKIIEFKNICYKVLSINANGIIVEDIENETVVDRLFTWDMIK